ncbi:MAG: cytochrome c oxidase subunit 3 [Planctomycetaceae bacterium]|nr:cytochrome c oxidase subunit 3 [Planctomycetaceae bacterium]
MRASPRFIEGRSRIVLRVFVMLVISIVSAAAVFSILSQLLGRSNRMGVTFTPAFAISSLLLGLGSFHMHLAVANVRRERQGRLRQALFRALVCGILFTGVQSYGLWALFPEERSAAETSLGVTTFVAVLTALHAMHFLVAVMFVSFVYQLALTGRYDHEYHWGVACCGWFWHGLGIVWMGILAVISIAM